MAGPYPPGTIRIRFRTTLHQWRATFPGTDSRPGIVPLADRGCRNARRFRLGHTAGRPRSGSRNPAGKNPPGTVVRHRFQFLPQMGRDAAAAGTLQHREPQRLFHGTRDEALECHRRQNPRRDRELLRSPGCSGRMVFRQTGGLPLLYADTRGKTRRGPGHRSGHGETHRDCRPRRPERAGEEYPLPRIVLSGRRLQDSGNRQQTGPSRRADRSGHNGGLRRKHFVRMLRNRPYGIERHLVPPRLFGMFRPAVPPARPRSQRVENRRHRRSRR